MARVVRLSYRVDRVQRNRTGVAPRHAFIWEMKINETPPITGSLEERRDNAINLEPLVSSDPRLARLFRQSNRFPLETQSAFIRWVIAVLIGDRWITRLGR